jgi:hypothetical protein
MEEAKLEFAITVNWRREDGSIATTQLATLARRAGITPWAHLHPTPAFPVSRFLERTES